MMEIRYRKLKNFLERYVRNKTPNSECFPYTTHDAYEVFGVESILQQYYLVGENWISNNKPIAILWCFNDWKFGFVSEYLKEYRVIFVPRKKNQFKAICQLHACKLIDVKKATFITWGYNESSFLRKYCKLNNIPLYRMEDGFLRSANLGAAHSTPYSLILDKSGFYYNCNQESDLENLLNSYELDEQESKMADKLLNLFLDSNLSKYNLPTSDGCKLSDKIKTKKRVLVIGQVDNDASIKYGNPEKWDSESLLKLAKFENPNSEIIYRPHPDVYRGYQKSKLTKKKIEKICVISSPTEPFVDCLTSVDHVYTISSLSGFEALLRNIKVTTVGLPFYSGWGLTDDRVKTERRKKKLTIKEIFYVSYIKYPIYLADVNNSSLAFEVTIDRIKADRYYLSLYSENQYNIKYNYGKLISESSDKITIIKNIDYSSIFDIEDEDDDYQLYICLYFYGLLNTYVEKNLFLERIRDKITVKSFNKLLLLIEVKGDYELYKCNMEWLLSNVEENYRTKLCLNEFYKNKIDIFDEIDIGKVESLFNALLSNGNLEDLERLSAILLIYNREPLKIISSLLRILEVKFKYKSVLKLSELLTSIDYTYSNRVSISYELKALKFLNSNKSNDLKDRLFRAVCGKQDSIILSHYILDVHNIENSEDFKLRLSKSLKLDNELSHRKIQSFLAIEDFSSALKTAKDYINSKKTHSTADFVIYSQALSYNNKIEEATRIIEIDLKRNVNSANIRELLRLCVLSSNYKRSLELLNLAQSKKIPLGDMHLRKAYFGNRMICNAFETFREISLIRSFKKHFSDKSVFIDEKFDLSMINGNVLFLSIFGPGDEIRFASIYNRIIRDLPDVNIKISCTPRLIKLFSRSFPKVEFVPVPRPRTNDKVDLNDYTFVPSSDYINIVNNKAISAIEESNHILFVTDMLAYYLKDYNSFEREEYLQASEVITNKFKERLDPKKIHVGISWRSSLTTHSRNEHYLTIEQLSPIFELGNVQYVNFQYDNCSEELEWIEKRYPGKIIDFKDVDHFNDFDSVAALMSCMDLIISPATTVAELSGSLGVKTWLLSNSSEIEWRKINHKCEDVWHKSMRIIEGDAIGDKSSLVDKLLSELRGFVVRENLKFTSIKKETNNIKEVV